MEANFQRALALVLKHEGGWADHPADPGGATMKGLTLATYRAFINKNGTKADLRNITQAQLEKVYREQYWNAVRADHLPSGVDFALFDYAVNSGPGRAVMRSATSMPRGASIACRMEVSVCRRRSSRSAWAIARSP